MLDDGTIWAWPMLLLDHAAAFDTLGHLRKYKVRWRQWDADSPVDYDNSRDDNSRDVTPEDKARIEAWVKAANA